MTSRWDYTNVPFFSCERYFYTNQPIDRATVYNGSYASDYHFNSLFVWKEIGGKDKFFYKRTEFHDLFNMFQENILFIEGTDIDSPVSYIIHSDRQSPEKLSNLLQ